MIECQCPDPVIRERLTKQQPNAAHNSEADLAVYSQQFREFSGIVTTSHAGCMPSGIIRVDTSRPVDETAREVVTQFLSPYSSP